MLQRVETTCPECHAPLRMDVRVNDHGNQTFPDGDMQHQLICGNCGTRAMVTLQGAGRAPTATPIAAPAKENRESRQHR